MKFHLKIKPAIDPSFIRDLEDLLNVHGYEIIGSGQKKDGSLSGITFEKEDLRDILAIEKTRRYL